MEEGSTWKKEKIPDKQLLPGTSLANHCKSLRNNPDSQSKESPSATGYPWILQQLNLNHALTIFRTLKGLGAGRKELSTLSRRYRTIKE